jgi:acetyltransferase-like isoleucine patch superfamily enzyme
LLTASSCRRGDRRRKRTEQGDRREGAVIGKGCFIGNEGVSVVGKYVRVPDGAKITRRMQVDQDYFKK